MNAWPPPLVFTMRAESFLTTTGPARCLPQEAALEIEGRRVPEKGTRCSCREAMLLQDWCLLSGLLSRTRVPEEPCRAPLLWNLEQRFIQCLGVV